MPERTATDTGLTLSVSLVSECLRKLADTGLGEITDEIRKARPLEDTGLTISDSIHFPFRLLHMIDQGATVFEYPAYVGLRAHFVGARMWARGRGGYSDIVR